MPNRDCRKLELVDNKPWREYATIHFCRDVSYICSINLGEGLDVGDSALGTTFASGDKQIKFADFHGKSNLIVVGDAAKHPSIYLPNWNRKGRHLETHMT